MILDRYLARRFLKTFGGTLLIFFGILALVDIVEEIQRFGDDVDGLWPILGLTLLNVPSGLYSILPLVVNLSDPSPAQGWRGLERKSLPERGRPDLRGLQPLLG